MHDEIKLSDKQKEAVFFESGSLLVKASAGSGKTRVLTERIKFLLGRTKRKILAITFTNKAGEEMRTRLGDIQQLNSKLFIGTFHGFCQNVLELRSNLLGYQKMPHIFEDESDRLNFIEQAIEATPSYFTEYKKLEKKEQRKFRYNALNFIAEVKRDLLSEDELFTESNDEDLVLLYRNYQEILSAQNAIDFDDLIYLTYRLFSEQPAIAALYRRSYEYICIDEAQDLNNAQYQLLKSLTNGEHRKVMMVGDPNQSIFAFNGSSSKYMTESFVEDFHPVKVVELNENYRSSIKVIRAAVKLLPNVNHISNLVIPGIFELHKLDSEEKEAEWVVGKIEDLINIGNFEEIEGDVELGKIAVLARNKYVFKPLEEKLKEKNIPFYYKITPGAIRFESKTMQIFDMALKIKINPLDTLHLSRLKSLLGIKTDNKELNDLISNTKKNHFCFVLEMVRDLKDDGSNFKKSIEDFIKLFETTKEIDDDNERKMIIDEANDILKHWVTYAKRNEKRSIHQFKNAMALGQTHTHTKENGLTLSTVHTMKGQEYEIVFIIGMDEDTFPDYRAVKEGGNELVQERNNAYVAFTRAKRFLYVSYPKSRLMPWGDTKIRYKSQFLKDFE